MSGEFTAFFYGTLMAPEVFFSVCYGNRSPPEAVQKLHTFTPAVLDGFCRHRVRYADYPGIVREAGQSVRGLYVTGLTSANMQRLGDYEGSEYALETVSVRLMAESAAEGDGQQGDMGKEGEEDATTTTVESSTYVYLCPEQLERREWDYEEFRRDRLRFWTRNGYC